MVEGEFLALIVSVDIWAVGCIFAELMLRYSCDHQA
jgi:hypothetical protein